MKLHRTPFALFFATVVLAQAQTPFHSADDDSLEVPGNNPLKYCNDPEKGLVPKEYILQLHNLDLDPNPPQAGKTLHISATGNLTKIVDKGSMVHVLVKMIPFITFLNKEFDLCDNAGTVGEKCPFHEGFWNISKGVNIPSVIPPGNYLVEMQAYTNKAEKITCMNGDVTF